MNFLSESKQQELTSLIRQGHSEREIARIAKVDRKTVRRYAELRRSRNHQRNKAKKARTSRNRIAQGVKYWRHRDMAAEAYIAKTGDRPLIPGDIVRFKSNSPKMVVASLNKTRAVVCRYDCGNIFEVSVPLSVLVRVDV